MAERKVDVAICGGGMVGLGLAAALDARGLTTAVVEAVEPRTWDPRGMDERVSSVTTASRHFLERLGVWDQVAQCRVSPFEAIHAWDAGGGMVRFHAADVGEAWLGHIVENSLLQRALYDHVRTRCGQVALFCPARIETADLEGAPGVRLRLDDGRRLRAGVLVGADGADSRVRAWAGIPARERAYGQQGIVANVRMTSHHGGVARQRFLPGGPLALLPLEDGRCSIVWSVPDAEAEAVLALDDAGFCQALEEASGQVLGTVEACGPRRNFPLRALHARRYVAGRAVLVGDAAHVIHPLAGQGVNLGFLDAAALAQVLGDAAERGRDPGGLPTLRRYERWRRGENLMMQQAMDGFHWLFSNRDPVRHALRNLGFRATDRMPPVKRLFMEYATGLRGDLPVLCAP